MRDVRVFRCCCQLTDAETAADPPQVPFNLFSGERGGMEEEDAAVTALIQGFSRLLEHLEERGTEEGEVVPKLRRLHQEITGIQEAVERFRLFREGQDLYTRWLMLVEQSDSHVRTGGDMLPTTPTPPANKAQLKEQVALAYNNRGYLKYLQVDFQGALQDYTVALRHNPELACAHYNRGLVTYRLAFFEQAVADMKAAVALDPSRPEFHEGLQKVTEKAGQGHPFPLHFEEHAPS